MRVPAVSWAISKLHRSDWSTSLFRTLTCQTFGSRDITRRGEFQRPLTFRPSEHPSLLLGMSYFEPIALREYRTLLRPGDSIFDIGANIGITAQRFDGILGGKCRIQAFEPLPRNAALLRLNVQYMGDRISVLECALGESEGQVEFLDNLEHGAVSQLAHFDGSTERNGQLWRKSASISIRMRTIDSVVASSGSVKPNFLKIDVEGAAGGVLRGAASTLASCKPVVSCSYHSTTEESMVCEALAQAGYRGLNVSPDGACEWTGLQQAKGTFVHPDDPRVATLTFRRQTIQ